MEYINSHKKYPITTTGIYQRLAKKKAENGHRKKVPIFSSEEDGRPKQKRVGEKWGMRLAKIKFLLKSKSNVFKIPEIAVRVYPRPQSPYLQPTRPKNHPIQKQLKDMRVKKKMDGRWAMCP